MNQSPKTAAISDRFIDSLPSAQNVIDLFQGEWSSKMPAASGLSSEPGRAALFADQRLKWAAQTFGGLEGMSVLELGPLEAAHSYLLQQLGARQVLAIESNTRAFLKCLCVKEIFNLQRVKFLLGDFNKFLAEDSTRHDLVVASGVLYHMREPLNLLKAMTKVSDRLFLWTHYYDAELIADNPDLAAKFGKVEAVELDGQGYNQVQQSYGAALKWQGFCGGNAETSYWLTRDTIIQFLRAQGFDTIHFKFEQPKHPNGPALALCAERKA